MATLKVYSREYGTRKVQEKVKFNVVEKIGYVVFGGVILLTNIVMLNYKGELYSLKKCSAEKWSSYCRKSKRKIMNKKLLLIIYLHIEEVKKIAESLGMKVQNDNIKVVR